MPDSPTAAADVRRKHSHYHKPVAGLEFIDVYRVLLLFNVTDPCIQHAVKKLLVAGGRGAGKDVTRDVQEAIDTMTRWQEMRAEDAGTAERLLKRSCACDVIPGSGFCANQGGPLQGNYCKATGR